MSSGPSRVAILGASDKPERISFLLLQRLHNLGYTVYPIHPTLESIDGHAVYRSLQDLPGDYDVLTVYVNAERSTKLEQDFLTSRASRIIFNPGSENPSLAEKLRAHGKSVEEACSLVLLSQGLL